MKQHLPRTSTLLLGAVFIVALLLYLWVRPDPPKQTPTQVYFAPSPTARATPTRKVTPTVRPRPTRTAKPTQEPLPTLSDSPSSSPPASPSAGDTATPSASPTADSSGTSSTATPTG